jgi:hypothetical protein
MTEAPDLSLSVSTEAIITAYQRRVYEETLDALTVLKPPPRADQLVRGLRRSVHVSVALREARFGSGEAVRSVVGTLLEEQGSGQSLRHGDLLNILLSLRSDSDWLSIIELLDKLGCEFPGRQRLEVLQLQGMALNRAGLSCQAEQLVLKSVKHYGADAETLGILGRIYKDRSIQANGSAQKSEWANRAITAYMVGALCNPGDVYPLINAMTLLVSSGKQYPRLALCHLIRLLGYRYRSETVDYFDMATGLEASVILDCSDIAEQLLDIILFITAVRLSKRSLRIRA